MKYLLAILVASLMLSACAPKVGSPEWCKKMEEKKTGDWSINEGKDYARHCVFK